MNNTDIAKHIVDTLLTIDFLFSDIEDSYKPEDVKKCYGYIDRRLETLTKDSVKIEVLSQLMKVTEQKRAEHINVCKSKAGCPKEAKYDQLILYIGNLYSSLKQKEMLKTQEDRHKDILAKLITLDDEKGDLYKILDDLDMSSDLPKLKTYIFDLKQKGLVVIPSDTTDGTIIQITDKGKEYLRGVITKKPINIAIKENVWDPHAPTKNSELRNMIITAIVTVILTIIGTKILGC